VPAASAAIAKAGGAIAGSRRPKTRPKWEIFSRRSEISRASSRPTPIASGSR
jgi:hypothetical protein